MRKNLHDRILKGEIKEQHQNTVFKYAHNNNNHHHRI